MQQVSLGDGRSGLTPAPLTLVGVGPGDPQLLTVAAVRAIELATVVAYPVAREGAEGMAATIAAPWISAQQRRLPLVFPMVSEAAPRVVAWHAASDALAAEVASGAVVVLLCEGDASLFASCSYVLLALAARHPSCPVRVIPGITSVAAAAAVASERGPSGALVMPWPLALQDEGLLIRTTPESVAGFERLLDWAAGTGAGGAAETGAQTTLALLKLGHRWSWVRPLLEQRGLLDQALFAQRVGWPEQLLAPAARVPASEQPYFSLLLVRQGWPQVLP